MKNQRSENGRTSKTGKYGKRIRSIRRPEVSREPQVSREPEVSKELEKMRQKLGQEIQVQEKAYTQATNDYKTKSATMNEIARAKDDQIHHPQVPDQRLRLLQHSLTNRFDNISRY